ncbi:MAG: hypothetical protein NUV97_01115 [archaeon]|nr:hypothetical protein [archaeon]MCR4323438.1 hypothetical protein [Nanoarchaeota archaeon]
MNKFIGIIFGLILFLAPISAWIVNIWGVGDAASVFFKGGLVWMLIILGAILLVMSLSSLKE